MKTKWTDEQREVLRKAAAILHRRGWLQNMLYKGDDPRSGPVCIVGAVHAAVNHDGSADWPEEERWGLVAEIRQKLARRLRTDPAMWNNKEGRSKSEVVGLLKAIAK